MTQGEKQHIESIIHYMTWVEVKIFSFMNNKLC